MDQEKKETLGNRISEKLRKVLEEPDLKLEATDDERKLWDAVVVSIVGGSEHGVSYAASCADDCIKARRKRFG